MWKTLKALLWEKAEEIRAEGVRNTIKKCLNSLKEYEAWLRTNNTAGRAAAASSGSGCPEILVLEEINIEKVKASGADYVLIAELGDSLEPGALERFRQAAGKDARPDLIYADEDEETPWRRKPVCPHLKPDYDKDLLLSENYIRYAFAVKRDLWLSCIVEMNPHSPGWRYELILRCIERTEHISHIPQILYHHRRKSWIAYLHRIDREWTRGEAMLAEHYRRCGIRASVRKNRWVGTYHTEYQYEEMPLVSVIIPSKDHAEDLNRCLESIRERSDYPNLEILIVENNSSDETTFVNYERLKALDERIRVISWEGEFNYAKINNDAARQARGDLLLFLNNDTELIEAGSIRAMVSHCLRKEVGIVGAKLFYGDGSIQHAGVVIGYGGTAGHAFITMPGRYAGYEKRAVLTQDYSAVTAACLMTKRSVFESVGGFRESFRVAYNDIDYCLKVREKGLLVVYTPDSAWFHYESKSRGYENTEEKRVRFEGECQQFRELWRAVLESGDPYYNRNLSLERADFARKE